MVTFQGKPKLAFFQYRYDPSLPKFLLYQKEEHVKCLAQFFEVTVINEDCDYRHVCDTIQPDVTLVEGAVSYPSCRKLKVSNRRAYPHIPKIGLMNADAFCRARAGFVSDMAQWGIDTVFAIATTAAAHTPHIAKHLFVWPVFVDDEIYRDYGQCKTIQVLFTGNTNSLYPWRQKIIRLVPKYYPSLIAPHPGYKPQQASAARDIRSTAGEDYARILNASQFVLACGTVAKEVVRKHFEIPASRACLVTERSRALEAAGFVDMRNCVLADERDILDKLHYLLSHPEELEAITEAGYELVRSRHTVKHRSQIRQWYELQRNLRTREVIVQPNPFEPLQVTNNCADSQLPPVISDGEHLQLLREGDEKLIAGKYEQAEKLYTRCWNYIPWMPEPQLRIAICRLCQGDAKGALAWVSEPLRVTLGDFESDEPDPVEWAYLIIILLCQGRIREANERALRYTYLRHRDLDLARAVINVICPDQPAIVRRSPQPRISIHCLPISDPEDWVRLVVLMLKACGQARLADQLALLSSDKLNCPGFDSYAWQGISESIPSVRPATESENSPLIVHKSSLYGALKSKLKHALAVLLHSLERRIGYFLPYSLSSARKDKFYDSVSGIAERDDVSSALVVGVNEEEFTTQALLAGVQRNNNEVAALYLDKKAIGGTHFGLTIECFKRENNIKAFDLVLIDLSQLRCGSAASDTWVYCQEAKFVVLDSTSDICRYPEYRALLRSSQHFLILADPTSRGGYAIFELRDWRPVEMNEIGAAGPRSKTEAVEVL